MKPPKLDMYSPTEDRMSKRQRDFYKSIEPKLQTGEYVDINGQIGYVFTYLYKLLDKWDKVGYESLGDFLIHISELYKHESKLSNYCLHWAHDCLLAIGRYDRYLDATEPKTIFDTTANRTANTRLNVQREIGADANPIDLLALFGVRKSPFATQNQALFKDKVFEKFSEYSRNQKAWFHILDEWSPSKHTSRLFLFTGTATQGMPELKFPVRSYYESYEKRDLIQSLATDAENLARESLGVPKIGEGWVSETTLFRKLESEFSQTQVIQHGRPSWLGRQHFDVWFPHWKIAIEYHGRQHFEPVEFFGGKDAFEKTVERDTRKVQLAKENSVDMIIVVEGYDIEHLTREIINIKSARNNKAPEVYSNIN